MQTRDPIQQGRVYVSSLSKEIYLHAYYIYKHLRTLEQYVCIRNT